MAIIVIDIELLQSDAFKDIRSAHTLRLLLEFMRRRKIHKTKDRRGKHSEPVILNNGEIILTYRWAKENLNIPQTTMSRCLTELVALGFLDISEKSCGLHKQPTKYALSGRWKKYGQADFEHVQRQSIRPPFTVQKKKSVTINGS